MNREYHRWYSPALGRDMELLIFGHAGAKVICFPTSFGHFYDWEHRGLIGSFEHQINQGWFQFYCVDVVDGESWYGDHLHPADRARRHEQYDQYLRDELLPFMHWKNQQPFVITTGASFGAYHAMNFALRHPDRINRVLAMSGLYDIRRFTGGYSDQTVYFNNPVAFVENEHDHYRLEAMRRMDIIIVGGRTDPLLYSSEHMSHVLWSKGVPHALRIWEGWYHDWPYWIEMLHKYLGGSD